MTRRRRGTFQPAIETILPPRPIFVSAGVPYLAILCDASSSTPIFSPCFAFTLLPGSMSEGSTQVANGERARRGLFIMAENANNKYKWSLALLKRRVLSTEQMARQIDRMTWENDGSDLGVSDTVGCKYGVRNYEFGKRSYIRTD